MANPTSNFGWQMPTSTDLVTDLPADFEVFGQAVDTDFVDLLGGANGYILSKASATDLDFAWIPNDQGDITAVNVTSPITGGGSAGAVTIGINAATTSVVGAVQLSDSTSTTSSVLASTPTATKAAYDLANGAIAKSVVTTAGDVIYRNATVPVRLGIGTAGQVLTVNTGATAPEWVTPATSGFVGYSGYSTGNQTIAHNTATAIPMGSETFDTSGFHDTTTNNTRITVPAGKAGYYLVLGRGFYDIATGGSSIGLGMRINAGTSIFNYDGTISTSAYGGINFSQITYLGVGDYVEFMAYQGTGGNLTLFGGTTSQTLSVQFLGA
jgi:hypothetical protein